MRPCHALKTSQKCFINMKPNRLSPSNRKVWSDINWNVESTIFECNGEMKLNTLKKRRQFYCLYCSSLFGIAKTTGHTPISFINCSSCNIAIPLSRSEFKLFAQNILVMKILTFVISGWSNQQISHRHHNEEHAMLNCFLCYQQDQLKNCSWFWHENNNIHCRLVQQWVVCRRIQMTLS